MVLFELRDRVKRYFKFSRKEKKDLLIVTFVLGFIFSFRDWGSGAVDIATGVRNLVIAIIVAALSVLVHESAHRIGGLWIGFKAEFRMWWGGLIGSLIIAFVSLGHIPLVLPGGVVNNLMVRHRLGEFRYGVNYWDNGLVALYGPLSNLFLAFIGKFFLDFFPQSYFLEKLFILNILFAVCTLLPLPNLDGINVFFGSRMMYIIGYAAVIAVSLLLYLPKVLSVPLAALIALIFVTITTILYYLTFEQQPS
jgi:Zn-dependent protease